MFGYVRIDKLELKVRDYEVYSGFYCGVCHDLSREFGLKGRISLTYDMTFLAIFLSGLYDNNIAQKEERCIVHPLKKHVRLNNRFTSYAADMNVLLTYYKCRDDWTDDRKLSKGLYGRVLKSSAARVGRKYPHQKKIIKRELARLAALERQNSSDIDEVSGCFGRLLACLFAYKKDEWSGCLEKFGFYLGKYIYLADACCDLKEDIKSGSYNVFKNSKTPTIERRNILTMMMSECARIYELLPIIDYNNILENIIYSGVWTTLDGNESKNKEKGNTNGSV